LQKIPAPRIAPRPKTISAEAGRWWGKICREYEIDDDAGRLLLQTALEAFDRMRRCQDRIARDGEAVKDRFGQLKAHPLLAAERDARSQMLAALRQMNLDVEPLRDSATQRGTTHYADEA